MKRCILSVDQGTTSTRVLLVDEDGRIVASATEELTQHYPKDGWVEHDAEEIWQDVLACARAALKQAGDLEVAGIGIANQRETTIVWDRKTLMPIHRAIVWQDRRTRELCDDLARAGRQSAIQEKTGLVLDPYFSATKLAWILDTVPGARARAERGELAFGTVDSWLIARFTNGRVHATDATNASRTMLYDINRGAWDDELLQWLRIPRALLPQVKDSADEFGAASREILGAEVPILGVAGDQQAAAFGQACFAPGLAKSTYGTGCFMLLSMGERQPRSNNKLLGTIAYRLGGRTSYALEGSIFMAGGVLEWLKHAGIVTDLREVGPLSRLANPASQLILVPGFTGLGAPYWAPGARGALIGMTRDTGRAEIAAAALEAVAFQTRDLLEAVRADMGVPVDVLRVDGGMAKSDEFLQSLADLTGVKVVRALSTETTALGAAYLAGLKAGIFRDLAALSALWKEDAAFSPRLEASERGRRYELWLAAVRRIL